MFLYFKMFRRKLVYGCFFVAMVYLYARYNHEPTAYELVHSNAVDNISCHFTYKDDWLPDVSEFEPKNAIFFHDTSCKGTLDSRQLCAIESAARAHTDREIYVLFSGPVSEFILSTDLSVLSKFDNVRLARVRIADYAAGTSVQTLLINGILNETKWGIENMSNVLRFLTLHKWSGVYLDLDVVVVKSFDSLPDNWIAREDKSMVNAAAMSLSDDSIGRRFAEIFLEEIVTSYRPDIWSHNGPGAVTRALTRECHVDVMELSSVTCNGLSILSPAFIYPIHYSKRKLYFKAGYRRNSSKAYVHHLWNRITHKLVVERNSLYEWLAKNYCPSVYALYGHRFGS